jgi:hypothetical protein
LSIDQPDDRDSPAAYYADLLADLNRLLREGLVVMDWTDDDQAPRFPITPRGRAVVEQPTAEPRT